MASWTTEEVCAAIEHEREIARTPVRANVRQITSLPQGLQLDLEPLRDIYNRPIDEALEGARACWAGGSSLAKADVFAVEPDEPSILLQRLEGSHPEVNDIISIYEPDFYHPLAELWSTTSLAARALQSLSPTPGVATAPQLTLDLRRLRSSQKQALGLARFPISLLWGPPGTGKTTTLGALVAEEIASRRSRCVIVTATTHIAVDQAVRAVDLALQDAGREELRSKIKRFGSRVDPKFFLGHEHLLPVQDREAFERIARLIEQEPPKSDLEAWSAWKQEIDALRARLKASVVQLLSENACVGMTLTSAFFWFQALLQAGLDLIVVDEASQVGGPAASMIATVSARTLFAGDPKQLSAVVRTKDPRSRKILSATAFDIAGTAPQVFLEEQSRMAPPICAIVSKVFYDGKLIVAKRERHDKKWLRDRSPNWIDGKEQPQFAVWKTETEAAWSQKYRGPIRHGSAQEILTLIDDMRGAYIDPTDILVLTPFRAQRAMLRRMLGARSIRDIEVRTVHRSQGGERRIVIFDPVDGAGGFLAGPEGDRLINVAISRAQAQAVVFLSQSDQNNGTLRRIAILSQGGQDAGASQSNEVPSLKDFASHQDFPECLRQKVLSIGHTVGEVIGIERGGEVLVIACHETGQHVKFKTKIALMAATKL